MKCLNNSRIINLVSELPFDRPGVTLAVVGHSLYKQYIMSSNWLGFIKWFFKPKFRSYK